MPCVLQAMTTKTTMAAAKAAQDIATYLDLQAIAV